MNEQDKHEFILNHVALHKTLLLFSPCFHCLFLKMALIVFELATNVDIFSLYVNEYPYNSVHGGVICLCYFQQGC